MGDISFECNVCNAPGRLARPEFARETASCQSCGSNVRIRALLYMLSMELFGNGLSLPDFPRVKSVSGLGLSDSSLYADVLTNQFDYRNTFYSAAPELDIMDPPAQERGKYDFIVASEIFEHVPPPLELALRNAYELLRPQGVLLFTIPYSLDASTVEHFSTLHEYGLAQVGDQLVLVNRNTEGAIKVFENLVFHFGSEGKALEMREVSESGLRNSVRQAGFTEMCIYSQDYEPFGVIHKGTWSLPIAARKGELAFSRSGIGEVTEQMAARNKQYREWAGNLWVRLGSKLGLVDLSPLSGGRKAGRRG